MPPPQPQATNAPTPSAPPPAASGAPAPANQHTPGREATPTPSTIAERATLIAQQHSKKPKDAPRGSTMDENIFTNITSKEQFTQEVNNAGNKLIIVSFHAKWCGACKMAAMTLRELARSHVDKLTVLRVDVEDMEELALENDVLSIPAFIYMHEKRKLGMEIGSNADKINASYEKYVQMRS